MSEDPQALGQRLKAERERRGMSTQKIANGMHLDEWVIDALEAGDYARIGPAVYAKGHLKKYASLLGVSSAAPPVDAPAPAPPTGGAYPPPIVRLDTPKGAHAAWPRIGTVAAVAILAGGVFWWREAHHGGTAPVVSVPPPSQAQSTTLVAAEDEAVASAEPEESADEANAAGRASAPTADIPVAASTAAAVSVPLVARTPAVASAPLTAAPAARPAMASASAAPAPAADLTPGVGKARLRLSFSADSWVSIRDYSGKSVFEGDGRANSFKTVAGMAPFRVYLRSASGVQLQLNDRAVAIGRQFISGDQARFEAGADGVLRREPPPPPGAGPQTAAVSPHG